MNSSRPVYRPSPRRRSPTPCTCRALMVIDSAPIRKKVLTDFKRSRTTFEKAEKELERHEREDVPAYTRWVHLEFGPVLEEMKEHQREMAILEENMSRIEAYHQATRLPLTRVARMFREEPARFRELEEREREKARKEEEREERRRQRLCKQLVDSILEEFEDFLKDSHRRFVRDRKRGLNTRQIRQRTLDQFFYEADLPDVALQVLMEDPRVLKLLEEYGLMGDAPENPGRPQTGSAPSGVDPRIKSLHRELAFALHPDRNPDPKPGNLELWHEVQEAVANRDLDRLEVLHAHVQVLSGEFRPDLAVSKVMELTRMYRDSRDALRRRIRSLRGEMTWGFSEMSPSKRDRLHALHAEKLGRERRQFAEAVKRMRAIMDMVCDGGGGQAAEDFFF